MNTEYLLATTETPRKASLRAVSRPGKPHAPVHEESDQEWHSRRSRPQAARALQKLLARAEAEELNTLEITRVKTKKFLGIRYASLCGHRRHIQESPFLFNTAEEVYRRMMRRAA